MDENLVHCSYEAGILEDPGRTPVSAFDHFIHYLRQCILKRRFSLASGLTEIADSSSLYNGIC